MGLMREAGAELVRVTFLRRDGGLREGDMTVPAREVQDALALTGASRRIRRAALEWVGRWYLTKPFCCGWSGPEGWSWVELRKPDLEA